MVGQRELTLRLVVAAGAAVGCRQMKVEPDRMTAVGRREPPEVFEQLVELVASRQGDEQRQRGHPQAGGRVGRNVEGVADVGAPPSRRHCIDPFAVDRPPDNRRQLLPPVAIDKRPLVVEAAVGE